MYTLYSDKQNIFECDIQLEGASLSQAYARLIIESDDINVMYNGTITSDGNCRITMPKLKGLVKEGGTLKLEIIADDMYFNPWESEYDLLTSKKVTVEVKQQTKQPIVENKTKVMVNVVNEESKKTKRKIVESKKKKTENVVLTKSDIESLMKRLS
tara:strand:+ start:918 stop:1385 length:468 start_codon:yes stop_codon:yes gene_type:complete